ncbi:hypothetical protein BJ085DRAFT_6089, partial [Dimargaris cristalligena]
QVKFTYYWIASQTAADKGNVIIGTCDGKPLASVSEDFAKTVEMEGTAKLLDGQFINLADCDCSNFMCFQSTPYALGGHNNALIPYSSIAVNDVAQGQTLYVEALTKVRLPNGQYHNGCVRADDESWSFEGNHIDWYVLSEANYENFN